MLRKLTPGQQQLRVQAQPQVETQLSVAEQQPQQQQTANKAWIIHVMLTTVWQIKNFYLSALNTPKAQLMSIVTFHA